MKFHTGDSVVVISGADRGKTGTIAKVLKKENKLVIEGINKRVKHVKGRDGEAGQRVEFFAPIDASNVAVQDPKTKKPTRIGYKVEGISKIRIAKASGEMLPVYTKAKKTSAKSESSKSAK